MKSPEVSSIYPNLSSTLLVASLLLAFGDATRLTLEKVSARASFSRKFFRSMPAPSSSMISPISAFESEPLPYADRGAIVCSANVAFYTPKNVSMCGNNVSSGAVPVATASRRAWSGVKFVLITEEFALRGDRCYPDLKSVHLGQGRTEDGGKNTFKAPETERGNLVDYVPMEMIRTRIP